MRKVFYNIDLNQVLIEGINYFHPFTLEAWDDSGRVSIRLVETSKAIISELYNEFTYQDGTPYGDDLSEVVVNLNTEFEKNSSVSYDFSNNLIFFINQNSPGINDSVNDFVSTYWREIMLFERSGIVKPLKDVILGATGDLLVLLNTIVSLVPTTLTLSAFMLSLLN